MNKQTNIVAQRYERYHHRQSVDNLYGVAVVLMLTLRIMLMRTFCSFCIFQFFFMFFCCFFFFFFFFYFLEQNTLKIGSNENSPIDNKIDWQCYELNGAVQFIRWYNELGQLSVLFIFHRWKFQWTNNYGQVYCYL